MPPDILLRALAASLLACGLVAQAPPGYYATVNSSSAATLRTTLHDVVDDHRRLPYTASSLDTWDVLESAWQDPSDPRRVVDVYRNRSFHKGGDRVSGYNREHVWPKSYGFPIDGSANYPFTDCHALFLSDAGYNAARSNLPFEDCTPSCNEHPTLPTHGVGGGSGVYPGNSNWSTGGAGAFGSWETWRHRRGDVARALFYLDLRYEGDVHGGTGANEPDLVVTDDRGRIAGSQTGSNEQVAYMGVLTALLRWHAEDPVDAEEMGRNNAVFQAQGNRNPFVDRPGWVDILWGGAVPGSFTRYGQGCAAATGLVPAISNVGVPSIGNPITVLCGSAPPFQPAVLNLDLQASSIDLGALGLPGCTALAAPGLVVTSSTNGFGTAATILAVPGDPRLIRVHLFAQWVALDPNGRGAALSDAADLQIGR